MSDREGRVPSSGLFRLTGYDRYDYSEYFIGDYPTLDMAILEARSRASVANASPPSFADIFLVYDHLGVCRYQITHDEL